jgi:hypothetical protein
MGHEYNPCKGVSSHTEIDAFKKKIDSDIATHNAELKEIDSDPMSDPNNKEQFGGVDRVGKPDASPEVKFSPRTGSASMS